MRPNEESANSYAFILIMRQDKRKKAPVFRFFVIFFLFTKAKWPVDALIPFMRPLRVLRQGAWYEIRSQINNREPLFRYSTALALFVQVFRAAELRFVFTVRCLRLEDDRLTFYIKPEDGMELPAIMKWIKQTFAQRYNRLTGRIGHIWGDRYWSAVLEGDPPVGAADAASKGEECEGGAVGRGAETGVRPRSWKRSRGARFPPKSPPPAAISPG